MTRHRLAAVNPRIPHIDVKPDITFVPNPQTNIPYSAHSVADAMLGNQYVANPTAPRFRGVDPKRFGFPPDKTVRSPNTKTAPPRTAAAKKRPG